MRFEGEPVRERHVQPVDGADARRGVRCVQCLWTRAREDGEVKESQGVARRVGGSTSQLEVRFAPAFLSFLPFVWGDYWIVGLDPAYRWALVGSPGRDYLWVLSRDRRLDAEAYARVVADARAMGYPVGQLVRTAQR